MNVRLNTPLQRLQTHLAHARQRAQDKHTIANEKADVGERLQALNRYLANTDPGRVLVLRSNRRGEARVSSRAPGWIDKHLNPTNVVGRRQLGLNRLLGQLMRQVSPSMPRGPAQQALDSLTRLFDKPMGQDEDPTRATSSLRADVNTLAEACAFGAAAAKVVAMPSAPLPTAQALGIEPDSAPAP